MNPLLLEALITKSPIWGTLYVGAFTLSLPPMFLYHPRPWVWVLWATSTAAGFYILTQP